MTGNQWSEAVTGVFWSRRLFPINKYSCGDSDSGSEVTNKNSNQSNTQTRAAVEVHHGGKHGTKVSRRPTERLQVVAEVELSSVRDHLWFWTDSSLITDPFQTLWSYVILNRFKSNSPLKSKRHKCESLNLKGASPGCVCLSRWSDRNQSCDSHVTVMWSSAAAEPNTGNIVGGGTLNFSLCLSSY